MREKNERNDLHLADQLFINKLRAIVLANLSDEHFNVERLVKEVDMSRTTIHRKLKLIENKNLTQFIREIRLEEARKLLLSDAETVAEVAYKVGFSSSAYFTRCFHEYFGYTPGKVRKEERYPKEGACEPSHNKETAPIKSQTALQKVALLWRKRLNKKLIPEIIVLICILAGILIYVDYRINQIDLSESSGTPEDELSIMILPFKNLSHDTANRYIADGIMEDILNDLFYISNMRVISRTTSEHFRETRLSVKEIAREVGVHNVLEGSVRKYGDRIRINVQLIDAIDDNHLWSANFDRDFRDVMGVQSEVAMQVALNLNAVVRENTIQQIRALPSHSPEAYDHYLRGRFLLHKVLRESSYDVDRERIMLCVKSFKRAIAADNHFVEAYAGLANAWFNLSAWGYLPANEGFSRSIRFSKKALEIDPGCAEAHTLKGAYHVWVDRQFEEARREFKTALDLNPNFPSTHQYYALLLMITGPTMEARMFMDHALRFAPYSWMAQNLNAWIYYLEEKYERSKDACLTAKDLKKDFLDNNWLLFLNYVKLDEGEKAMQELQNIVQIDTTSNQFIDEIQNAYEASGMHGLFTWLIRVNRHKPVPVEGLNGHPFFIAWWHVNLRHKEESLFWLQKTMKYEDRINLYVNLMACNPDFDFLRADPRFHAVIDEIGLSPYHIWLPK